MDELENLLKNARQGTIGASRPTGGKPAENEPNLLRAVKATMIYLREGAWEKASGVHAIAKMNNVPYIRLCDECGVAESESGRWVCIMAPTTPGRAPDEV